MHNAIFLVSGRTFVFVQKYLFVNFVLVKVCRGLPVMDGCAAGGI